MPVSELFTFGKACAFTISCFALFCPSFASGFPLTEFYPSPPIQAMWQQVFVFTTLSFCICVSVYLCICVSRVYLCIVCSAEVGRRPQWRWCRSHQNHQLHQLACIRHTVSTLRARRTGWDPRWAMSVASLRFSQDSVPYGHWYCAPGCFQSTSSCTGVSPNTIGIVWSFQLDEASRCSANKDF